MREIYKWKGVRKSSSVTSNQKGNQMCVTYRFLREDFYEKDFVFGGDWLNLFGI